MALSLFAGLAIGLSLGALGGGGSILAVPVLVGLLGQTPLQATSGSLVIVAAASISGAIGAHRAGNVLLGRGALFAVVALGGAIAGARWSTRVDGDLLLAAFSALLLVVGFRMALQLARRDEPHARADLRPLIRLRPSLMCDCPRALKLVVAATAVGALTGFLGVGGGFLVVPALTLVFGLPMATASGTSLVAVAITSLAALATRSAAGGAPDWGPVLALTAVAVVGAVIGARVAARTEPRHLSQAFTALILLVAVVTAGGVFPDLV